jgi:hypothetical protein
MAPSPTVPTITWGEDVPTGIRLREMAVLQGDLNQLHAELASIRAEIEQKGTTRAHLEATLTAQRDLIATLKDRSSMREMLLKSNFGSKAAWLDAMEKVKTQEVTLASELGQRADMEASLEVLNRDLLKRHADSSQTISNDWLTPNGKPMIWLKSCGRLRRGSTISRFAVQLLESCRIHLLPPSARW